MQVDEIERERIAAREAGGVASGRYSRSNLSAMEAPEFSTEPANEFHSGALKWGGGGSATAANVCATASLQAK